MIQQDQAAIELARRDEWRKTLDREIQLNTAQIEAMQERVRNSVVTGGMAYDLQLFIARRGWEIGYATSRHTIQKWDSMREWIEDYTDNGGLQSTPSVVFDYIAITEVKVTDMQREAATVFCRELEPVDRLAVRDHAMKVAMAVGDQDLVDIVHDETKRSEGNPNRGADGRFANGHRSVPVGSTKVRADTKEGARLQVRRYASDPKTCERYGKDHALCQEAWVKLEAGEFRSPFQAQEYCGLRKKEPPRRIFISADMVKLAGELNAVIPTDRLTQLVTLLQECLNER